MSSISRWRKGEILRAVGMGDPRGVVLLMASNDTGNPARGKSRPTPTQRRRAQNARSPTLPRSGLVQCSITGRIKGRAAASEREAARSSLLFGLAEKVAVLLIQAIRRWGVRSLLEE